MGYFDEYNKQRANGTYQEPETHATWRDAEAAIRQTNPNLYNAVQQHRLVDQWHSYVYGQQRRAQEELDAYTHGRGNRSYLREEMLSGSWRNQQAQETAERRETAGSRAWESFVGMLKHGLSVGQTAYMSPTERAEWEKQGKEYAEAFKQANKDAKARTNWAGRDKLIKEYKELQNKLQHQSQRSPENMKRFQEVKEELERKDAEYGNGKQPYSFADRSSAFFGGTVKDISGSLVSTGTTLADYIDRTRQTQKIMSDFLKNPEAGVETQTIRDAQNAAYRSDDQREKWDALYATAKQLGEDAAADLDKAKGGLGFGGKALVDIGSNVIQMGFDAAVGSLTGGSALVPMAARVFGQGAQEARNAGATLNQQIGYGLSSAAIELATEKISDGVALIYGGGVADEVTEKLIGRLAKSDTGRSFLRLVAGGVGEGAEEVVSDLLSPLAESIYKDESIGELYKQLSLDEILYDYFIGAAIGTLGGATNYVNGTNTQKNAELRMIDEQRAQQQAARQAGYGGVSNQVDAAWDVLSGRVTPEQQQRRTAAAQETLGLSPRQAQAVEQYQNAPQEVREKAAARENDRALLTSAFSDAGIELNENEQETLTSLMQEGSGSTSEKITGMRDAYRLGAAGRTLEETELAMEDKSLSHMQLTRAWGFGASVQTAESGTADVSTEEGKTKVEAALSPLGRHVEEAVSLYEPRQDVGRYSAAMQKAAFLYAANGADVAKIAQDARDGKAADIVGILTDEQIRLAQQIGQEQRQKVREAEREADGSLTALRQKAAEIGKGQTVTAQALAETDKAIDVANRASQRAVNIINQTRERLEAMVKANPRAEQTEAYRDALDNADAQIKKIEGLQRTVQELKRRKAELEGRKTIQRKKGTVSYAGGTVDGVRYDGVDPAKLTRQQKKVTAMVETLADAVNLDYVFISAKPGMGGAYVKGGTVYVNINAGMGVGGFNQTMAAASLSHELTHWMQDYAPEQYRELKDFIVSEVLKADPQKLRQLVEQQRRWEQGRSLSYEQALDEVVANACQTMLLDSKAINKLARQNMSLAARIADFIEDWTNKIREAFAEVDTSRGEIYDSLRAVEGSLDQIQELWDNGIENAAKNYNAQQLIGSEKAPIKEVPKFQMNSESGLEYSGSWNYEGAIRVYKGGSWAELDMKSGEILRENPKNGMYPGLTETDIEEARKALKKMKPAPYKNAFIRFGRLPKSGISKNYASGENERGVSVYEAAWNIINGSYQRNGGLDGAAIKYLIEGAPIYLVSGEQVGVGSDGEPVIRNAKILETLSYDPGKDGYVIKEEKDAAAAANYNAEQTVRAASAEASTEANENAAPKGDVKNQFIGESAETADKDALALARQLDKQGVDNESIRQQTGWFKGMDGKWRFEIDDSKMKYDPSGDFNGKATAQVAAEGYTEAYKNMLSTVQTEAQRKEIRDYMLAIRNKQEDSAENLYDKLSQEFGFVFETWASKYAVLNEPGSPGMFQTAETLGDYIKHDKLFAAYPYLKDYYIAFEDMPSSKKGYVDGDTVFLNKDLRWNSKEAVDTLVHELQHVVQIIEGFSKGSSPTAWERRIKEGYDNRSAQAKKDAAKAEKELQKIRSLEPGFYTEMMVLEENTPKVPRGKIVDWDTLESEPDPQEWKDWDSQRDALSDKYGEEKVFHFISLMQDYAGEGKARRDSSNLYYNTAGEIEARDVTARRNMTAEQRRNTPPDLGNEDTVFANGGGVSNYIGYTNQNRPVVIVGEDILNGVPQDQWRTVALKALRKFTDGVPVAGKLIRVNQHSRNEYLNSHNTRYYEKKDQKKFADKLRAANNADEIIIATTDYVNEAPNHERKDSIIDMARGKLLMRIGNTDYRADVLVGFTKGNALVLHDVEALKETDEIRNAGLRSSGRQNSDVSPDSNNPATDSIADSAQENKTPKEDWSGTNYQRWDDTDGDTAAEANGREQSYARLQSENKILSNTIKGLNKLIAKKDTTIGQLQDRLKLNKTPEVREADAKKLARQLLREHNSIADFERVAADIKTLGDYLAQTKEVSEDEVKSRARNIAAEILQNATEQYQMEDEQLDTIRGEIKGRKLTISPDFLGELDQAGGYDLFRRQNFGKFTLAREDSKNINHDDYMSVSQFYADMQNQYGKTYFPDAANEGEESIILASVMQAADPIEVNPYRQYMGEATEELANRITQNALNGILRLEPDRYADAEYLKEKSRNEALNARVKQLVEENALSKEEAGKLWQQVHDLNTQLEHADMQYRALMNAAEDRIWQVRAEGIVREVMTKAKERERATEKIQALKDHYKELQQNAKERRDESAGATKYRDQVLEKAKKLREMLLKNDDKTHVPEVLKEPLAAFLESLDFTSKRALRGGAETNADRAFAANLQKIQQILSNQRDYINGGEMKTDLGGYIDVSPDSMDFLRRTAELITTAMAENRDYTINSMSAAELKELSNFLSNLRTAINGMNQFMANARFESVREAASQDIQTIKELGRVSTAENGGLFHAAFWENGTPYYVFRRFGEGGRAIFDSFTRGWEKMAFNVQEVMNFTEKSYTDKEVREWQKQTHDITLEDGSEVTMTTGQIMSLAMLLNREQAVKHLSKGGMRIGDIEGQKGTKTDTRHHHLTDADISAILGKLTERQMNVAKALQHFMAVKGSEWGNEISMRRFGYRFYTEGDAYFPIKTDSNDRPMSDTDAQQNSMFRLLNLSASKSLNPKASNALIVDDIFNVFADHMSDMAKLNGMGLPILDAIKWFNFKERIDLPEGGYDTRTMQGAMEDAFGKQALSYFRTLMKDINGVTESGDRGTKIQSKIVGNYKAAAVGANLRVAFLQPTSYVRASYLIKPQYLLQAFTNKNAYREAMENSGTAVWKDLGYYDTNIARGMRDQIKHNEGWRDKIVEKSMALAGFFDKLTWGRLWVACKMQAAAETGKTGDELIQATTDLFREVIYSSQVMDSTLTRSELMRGTSETTKVLTAFMAEPTLSYNMVMDAAMEYNMNAKRYGKGEALKRSRGYITKAATVYVCSAAFSAIVESIADAFRDDDDYESFLLKWSQAMFGEGNLLSGNLAQDLSLFGKIPYIKNFISVLQGFNSGDMSIAAFNNILNTVAIWTETIKLATGALDKPTKVTYYGNMTTWGKIYKTLQALSQGSGLALANMTRDVTAIWNSTVGAMYPDYKVKTYDAGPKKAIQDAYTSGHMSEEEAIQKLMESGAVEDDDKAYWTVREWDGEDKYSQLKEAALNGNADAVKQELEQLTAHGVKEKDAISNLKSFLKKAYTGEELDKAESKILGDRQLSESDVQKILTKFGDMDDNKAYLTVKGWETGDSGKYTGALRAAFSGDQTAFKRELSDLTSHGVKEKDVRSNVKSFARDLYFGNELSEEMQEVVGGKTLSDGDIRKMLHNYGGLSVDDANKTVAGWKEEKELIARHGDEFGKYDLSTSQAKYYYDTVKGRATISQYAEQVQKYGLDNVKSYYDKWQKTGLTMPQYETYRTEAAKCKGTDNDRDGKTDSGSKKAQMLQMINRLPVSNAVKDKLYLENGWAERLLYEAPWR